MKRSKRERRVVVIYFHNLSGFDGIIILRHLALNYKNEIAFETLYRNGSLYRIILKTIPKGGNNKKGRSIVKFYDSLKLLPSKLKTLASSFVPELGKKGEMDYHDVKVSNLTERK